MLSSTKQPSQQPSNTESENTKHKTDEIGFLSGSGDPPHLTIKPAMDSTWIIRGASSLVQVNV